MYKNNLLGLSKTELKKEWDSCWEKLAVMDPMRNHEEWVELNRRFDKCVEAYYAVDHGDYWMVQSASKVRGKYKTYKVIKVEKE